MDNKDKYLKITTPQGIAKYPWLIKAVTIHRAEELGNVMLEQLTDLFHEN